MTNLPLDGLFRAFAANEFREGRLDRRTFLAVASGAIAAPLLVGPGAARAAGKAFVVATFGGGNLAVALKAHVATPFSAAESVTWEEDPSGPLSGRIRSMVEAGQPIWDVCDSTSFTARALGKLGMLEPIDYAIVDKSLVRPDCVLEHGVSYSWFSLVSAYDKAAFPTAPASWADVFDVERFPGKRAFWRYGYCWEAALLADGVAPEDLYPLDVDRAVKKFRSIRDHSIFVEDVPSSLRSGEIQIGVDFTTGFGKVVRAEPERFGINWAGGVRGSATFVVPKGNLAGAALSMRFINFALNKEVQAAICDAASVGPSNPDATALLSAEAAPWDPRNPAWAESQIPVDEVYTAENEEYLIGEFLDRVAG